MIRGLVEGSLALTDDGASCRVCFQADEAFFAGHFPGHPIVPGVIMLECLVGLAQRFSRGGKLLQMNEAKFRHEVSPGMSIDCLVKRAGAQLSGVVTAAGQPVVEAHFTLEGQA